MSCSKASTRVQKTGYVQSAENHRESPDQGVITFGRTRVRSESARRTQRRPQQGPVAQPGLEHLTFNGLTPTGNQGVTRSNRVGPIPLNNYNDEKNRCEETCVGPQTY